MVKTVEREDQVQTTVQETWYVASANHRHSKREEGEPVSSLKMNGRYAQSIQSNSPSSPLLSLLAFVSLHQT